MRRLGGTARVWRTDRLATVIVPGTRDVQPSLRSGGEALRRDRGAVPTAAREPQGRGRSRGALHVRTVVADDDRDHPRGGAGVAGPLPRRARRRPRAPHRHRRAHDRRRARRHRAAPGAARRRVPRHDRGHPGRRRQRDGRVPREPLRGPARAHRRDPDVAAPAGLGDRRDPLARRRPAGRAPARAGRRGEHRAQRRAARRPRAGRAVRVHHRPAL